MMLVAKLDVCKQVNSLCLYFPFFVNTVKKVIVFPVPSRDVSSLVSDIPAGDRKNCNLFLQ